MLRHLCQNDTGEADQTGFHYTRILIYKHYLRSHIIHNTHHISLSKAQETAILENESRPEISDHFLEKNNFQRLVYTCQFNRCLPSDLHGLYLSQSSLSNSNTDVLNLQLVKCFLAHSFLNKGHSTKRVPFLYCMHIVL